MLPVPQSTFELTAQEQDLVLELVLQGKSIPKVAKQLGIRYEDFFYYLERYPEFRKRVDLIREGYVDDLVHSLIGITAGCTTMAEVSASKVESENIKWAASKFKPRIYGENLNVNVSHSLDLSSILLAAEDRVLPILTARAQKSDPVLIKSTLQDAPQSTIDVEPIPMHVQLSPALNERERLNESSVAPSIPDELADMI